jgi:hypothetical protein
MTVNEILQWVNFRLNKSQTGNTLNQSEFNTCLAWGNLEYFKIKYGLPEEYPPGMPLPRQAWAVTQENIDALSPFLKGKGGRDFAPLKLDNNGRADIPSDYVHYSSIRYGKVPVDVVSNDVYGDRLNSPITYGSKRYPFVTFYAGYMEFSPIDLGYVNFDYLRLPSTPIWGATIVNDQYVYNPNTSVQLEWSDIYHLDIANLILGYAASNLRDGTIMQVAQQRKISGQ